MPKKLWIQPCAKSETRNTQKKHKTESRFKFIMEIVRSKFMKIIRMPYLFKASEISSNMV